ncbi:MAG: hypothetical protein H0W89_05110 [Candidatus Levybacteria bacterium]|nr:hypothetical protein [Candidatus Levybacteria bacterium]
MAAEVPSGRPDLPPPQKHDTVQRPGGESFDPVRTAGLHIVRLPSL